MSIYLIEINSYFLMIPTRTLTFLAITSIAILVAAFGMNVYKIDIMINNVAFGTPYQVFPWSDVKINSKSNPQWLILHVVTSLLNILLTCSIFLVEINKTTWTRSEQLYTLRQLHAYTHYLFTFLILMNLQNLGKLDKISAVIFNGFALTGIMFIWSWPEDKILRLPLYLFMISIPIFVEIIAYAATHWI